MDGTLQYSIEAEATGLNNAVKGALASLAQLSTGITATAAKYGLLAGGGALAAGLGIGTKIAAEREQVKIAFENIIGDAAEAKRVLAELYDFANSTPFESDEILGAARKLLAAGVATTDLRTELTALGNVAAGVGTDIGGLATIYSQISDKGKVMAEELMQFGERGAGAIRDQLAKSLGVTKGELIELTSTGKVSFDQFRTALMQLAGASGKWGNLMQQQSQSTLGLFSSLKDAITMALDELGRPLNDAIKPILSDAIGLANDLKPVMADVGSHVAKAVTAMRAFVADAGKGGSVVSGLAGALGDAFSNLWGYIAPIGQAFGTIAIGFGQALLTALEPFANALYASFEAAGYAMKAMLLDALSELPGMGHLKELSGGATFAGEAALKRSDAHFSDAGSAGSKAMDIVAKSIEEAGEQVKKSWELAARDQRNAEKDKAMAEMQQQWAGEQATKDAAGFEAFLASQKNQGNRTPAGAFGSDAQGSLKEAKSAAGDAAKEIKSAGQEAAKLERARASDELKKTARAADQAAASLGRVSAASAAEDGTGRASKIMGGSMARMASGEQGRNQWNRLADSEKKRWGNDPGRWLNESSAGQAANRQMNQARGTLQRQGLWNPAQATQQLQARGNQAVGGNAGGRAQGQPATPAATTQDSGQRVLLQGILTELRRMAGHLGNLTKA